MKSPERLDTSWMHDRCPEHPRPAAARHRNRDDLCEPAGEVTWEENGRWKVILIPRQRTNPDGSNRGAVYVACNPDLCLHALRAAEAYFQSVYGKKGGAA